MPGAASAAWADGCEQWTSGKSRGQPGASSFLDIRPPRGKTSNTSLAVPLKIMELLAKTHPLKSGILAMSKRYGTLGQSGAALHQKSLRHHGVGLLDTAPGQDPYAADYGYGGYGYDPYAGGYDPYAGGYDAHGSDGAYAAAAPPGQMEELPNAPELMPAPGGEAEALKAELEDEALKQCKAKCPVWDPLATAKPEDLQHASLLVLQRLARPERRLAPSLRRASAAVDAAGRSFERWVRKRQDLGRELPKLRKIMMACKTMEDERDDEEVDNDLEAIQTETDRARQQAQKNAEEAELAQEGMLMQDVGHMQGKADRLALEQEMQQQDRQDAFANSQEMREVNAYNQQGADLQERQMEEVRKRLASSSLELKASKGASRGSRPTSLQSLAKNIGLGEDPAAHAHHHHHHYGGHEGWYPHCDDGGCYDEYGGYWDDIHGGYWDEYGRYWEEGWGGYWNTDGTYYVKDDADEGTGWQDWFKQCGQIRIPPSIVATRRAASEAYWDFDRSLALAEKAVDDALTSARIKGE